MTIESDKIASGELSNFESFPEKYGWETQNDRGYKIVEELCGTKRPLRVIALGAGASGICLARFLPQQLENVSLSIYDKNPEFGGTWYENRYPGCACDIPSHIYQFSWAKNPHWSHYYSDGPEILKYFKDVVDLYDLSSYFNLNHMITGAYWDSEQGVWNVHVKNLIDGTEKVDVAEVFINCSGILNAWSWPNITGLKDFQGTLCHTANYDPKTDLDGKRVAVIGIGSSGVQIIPNIVNQVSKLYAWVRSPTWMTAGFAQKFAGPNGQNFRYTEEQKQHFRQHPDEYLDYCKQIETEVSQIFKMIMKGSPESEAAKKFSTAEMMERLGSRKDIMDKIIPRDFSVGCRRPTPGNGFLEALTDPKVTTFTQPLQKVTEKGFIDNDGIEHDIDVLVCATGFDTSWVPRFPIVANGINVQDVMAERPRSYLSMAVTDIPNYFTVGGPYFSFGHGSYTTMVELFVNNILQIVKKVQKEHIKSIAPRKEATDNFVEHADLWLKRTVWSESCNSWFKNGKKDGVLTIFPGSRLVLADLLASPRYEDYSIEYDGLNRFQFLGNGFADIEFNGSDIAWYLGTQENPGGLLPESKLANGVKSNGTN